MNLSLESIDALITAAYSELDGLGRCVRDLESCGEHARESTLLASWKKHQVQLRTALTEAMAYRDHLRRISR